MLLEHHIFAAIILYVAITFNAGAISGITIYTGLNPLNVAAARIVIHRAPLVV
jgi:hypothetical protein